MVQQIETDVFYPESDGQPMGETDLHRQLLADLVFALSHYFARRRDVYVTGNLFLYFVKGQPSQVVCPDVCVVIGSRKRRRSIYQTWRDGPFPQVVIELTSVNTRAEDDGKKRELYERLGVLEYYLFDPHFDPEGPIEAEGTGDLKRYRRLAPDLPFGAAEVAAPGVTLHSDTLGLGLTVRGQELRLLDETTGLLLPTPDDEAAARQAEAAARRRAEERAQALADEVERLRAELEQRS